LYILRNFRKFPNLVRKLEKGEEIGKIIVDKGLLSLANLQLEMAIHVELFGKYSSINY